MSPPLLQSSPAPFKPPTACVSMVVTMSFLTRLRTMQRTEGPAPAMHSLCCISLKYHIKNKMEIDLINVDPAEE